MSPAAADATSRPPAYADEAERTERSFSEIVDRLSRVSVDKGVDAYADIDWEHPDMAIDRADVPVDLPSFDPLVHTDWYRSSSPAEQAEVGAYRAASMMKVGWNFENLLQRGLLAYAYRLPNGHPAFRYVHHEIIEESQHSLMFQEYVNRTALPVRGMSRLWTTAAGLLIEPLAKYAPGMFFVMVMGGEDPVDRVQRRHLEEGIAHPLTERIIRVHVAEEARHLSFARHLFRRTMSEAGRPQRAIVSVVSPVVLGIMARIMLDVPKDLIEHCDVPRSTVRQIRRSPERADLRRTSLDKTRRLFAEVGLLNPVAERLWKAMGI